jgi:hypothetical protein
VPALGPYPSRGDYEHCFTLESASGEFIPLSPAACDWVVRALGWAHRQERRNSRSAIGSREARRERDWDRSADDALDEVLGGAVP